MGANGVLDFREIYGNEFEDGQRNLYKYFVKSFGCRLADNNYSIPEDLRILLSKKRFRTRLRITFSVNEVFLEHKLNILSNGPLMTFFPSEESRPTWIEKWRYKKYGRMRPLEYICSENFKWFCTWFWYNVPTDGSRGSTWGADSQYVYLGSHESL